MGTALLGHVIRSLLNLILISVLWLLAGALAPTRALAAAPFCEELFESLDTRIVAPDELTPSLQLRAIDLLGQGHILHYTTLEGLRGILRSRRLIADDRRRVFVTREGFSHEEAERVLFIGSARASTRGSYVIILRKTPGAVLADQTSNPFELLHQGSYRFTDADILYAGTNPF